MSRMTPERWQRVTALLDEVLPCDPSGRETLLRGLCGKDEELRREVESLLSYEDASVNVLEEPLVPWHPDQPPDREAEAGESAAASPEAGPGRLRGERIGPYKILERLGTGGMGTVFLVAREDDFQQRVALKQIRRRMLSEEKLSEEVLFRFENERQILADLDHPNIARILDGGQTEDLLPYFTMEYVEGQPIDRYCDERRLPVRERLRLVLQVCSALQLAHQNLVVHRDLKPGNILVTPEGVPKLIDFGIAKHLGPKAAPHDVATEAGSRPMTLRYASPEQLWGLPVTTASDVYSLGVLLYQLLTGHDPYPFQTGMLELYRSICEREPVKPSLAVGRTLEVQLPEEQVERRDPESVSRARGTHPERLRSALSGDLDGIVLKALRKQPENRYHSVEQLADDLRRHLDGLPVSACEGTFRYLASKFVRRHAWSLTAVASILAVLTVSMVAVTVFWRRAAEEEARAERTRAESAERTVRLLGSMIEAFDPDTTAAQQTRLETLQHIQQGIVEHLGQNPELLADLLRDPLRHVYGRLGHDDEALATVDEALRILRKLHPGDHPDIAEVLNNQGVIHYRMGDLDSAERSWRHALEMKQRLGLGDADSLELLSNFATLLARQRKLDEAEARYRQVIEIQDQVPGTEAQELATTLRNLGTVLFLQGKLYRAEEPLRSALARELGADEPSSIGVAKVRSTLGRILHAQGRLDEAAEQLTEALAVRLRRLDIDHIAIARAARNLAAVMIQSGELATAEALLALAQPALRRRQLEDDWEIAELESLLGGLMVEQGRLEEAETCLIESYEMLEKTRGSAAIYSQQALARVIHLYEKWDQPERAATYRAALVTGSK